MGLHADTTFRWTQHFLGEVLSAYHDAESWGWTHWKFLDRMSERVYQDKRYVQLPQHAKSQIWGYSQGWHTRSSPQSAKNPIVASLRRTNRARSVLRMSGSHPRG